MCLPIPRGLQFGFGGCFRSLSGCAFACTVIEGSDHLEVVYTKPYPSGEVAALNTGDSEHILWTCIDVQGTCVGSSTWHPRCFAYRLMCHAAVEPTNYIAHERRDGYEDNNAANGDVHTTGSGPSAADMESKEEHTAETDDERPPAPFSRFDPKDKAKWEVDLFGIIESLNSGVCVCVCVCVHLSVYVCLSVCKCA